jgi:hypothetical protein
MNTKDFVKALRAVIREEVRSAVRQEVKELLAESTRRTTKPVIAQQAKQPTPAKKYTGNSIIDQVLNETRLTSDFRQSPEVADWPEMSYNTDSLPSQHIPTSIMDMDAMDDSSYDLPSAPSSGPSFMKDYTQLMKKADQVASQKQF